MDTTMSPMKMDTRMFLILCLCLVFFCGLPVLSSICPDGCSCFYDRISDGSKAQNVLCSAPELTSIPTNIPTNVSKLHIEKTNITRISSEAFISLRNLQSLWMSFNFISSLHVDSFRGLDALIELHLEGNFIASFPWESLTRMPNLRLLDLHNNMIRSVPSGSAVYLKNLTYFDLSSNNLTTLPSEVQLMWFSAEPAQEAANSNRILGLHDNPWNCDCRLFDLVHFQKSPTSMSAFIDSHLRCLEPESFSGVLFTDVELRRCQVPQVHTAVAKVHTLVNNSVLLRCGTVGVPTPELTWSRSDGKPISGSVQEEVSVDGITWSILRIPNVSIHDSGKYVCRATNFVGGANAVISLITPEMQQVNKVALEKRSSKMNGGIGQAAFQEKLVARHIIPASTSVPIIETFNGSKSMKFSNTESISTSGRLMDALGKDALSNLESNTSSLQQVPAKMVVRSVKVIGDTDHTVLINWRAPSATNTTWFSVLYAVFGQRDMKCIHVGPGKHRITIKGLVPKTKYVACVCVKGLIPKKEQCVIFSTDEAVSARSTQKLINVVVITVACVTAVPLTLIVCCGALKRRLQKLMIRRRSKDIQETYLTFETLTPGGKAIGMDAQYISNFNQDESNRLLLAGSSVDSVAVNRTAGHPKEYSC